jgi:hypothetical protein
LARGWRCKSSVHVDVCVWEKYEKEGKDVGGILVVTETVVSAVIRLMAVPLSGPRRGAIGTGIRSHIHTNEEWFDRTWTRAIGPQSHASRVKNKNYGVENPPIASRC